MSTPWERAQQSSAAVPPAAPTATVPVPTVDVPLPPSGVQAAQAAAATQAALPIVTSKADKAVALGTWALNTAGTSLAPAASSINPSLNPSGAGGWEVAAIGNAMLCLVQAFQSISIRGHKFPRDGLGPWIIFFGSVGVCVLIWILVPLWVSGTLDLVLMQKGIINGLASFYNGFQAFGPLSKLGVMSGQAKE